MNSPVLKCVVLTISLLLVACASTPDIRVETRHGTDFSRYKTYAFVEKPGTDREGYSTILTSHFKSAVQQEMQARGYQLVATDPDLQVNFFSNVESRSETRSTPRMSIGYFHYRGGISMGFPIASTDIETRNYKVGTVNIDVVDARRKEMIWSGMLEGALSNKAMENPADAIRSAVSQIYSRYPVATPAQSPAQ